MKIMVKTLLIQNKCKSTSFYNLENISQEISEFVKFIYIGHTIIHIYHIYP